MPIPFTCPHCGEQTTVTDEHAGQSGPCSKCGKTIFVPGRSGASAPVKSSKIPIIIAILVGGGFVALICGGIPLALLLPAVQAAREAARRASCINEMKQVGLCMHNYHDKYNCFPPAYLPDENGEPMHSWRVLLLPDLGHQDLYDQYNFDEPWDSPSNLSLLDRMPSEYRCPSESDNATSCTSYVVIVGPNTAFPGAEPLTFGDFKDGMTDTIMVVESSGSNINWLEPRDLDVDQIGNGEIGSKHIGVFNAVFCDGSVRSLDKNMDAETLGALIDRQDGTGTVPY